MNIVTRREFLHNLLKEYINDDYSIGFHGIAKYRLSDDSTSVHGVLENVLGKGLKINDGRTLLGTVEYLNDDLFDNEEDFVCNYMYGDTKEYIIVSIPKVLRNSKGEEIYLGYPTYGNNGDAPAGYQVSSLADLLIPDYTGDVSILPPEFILGKLVIDRSSVTFVTNNKHMSLNGNIVDDDFFEKRKKMMILANMFYGVDLKYKIDNDEDCELNTEIIEEEYQKLMSMNDDEKMNIEKELQKLDFHTRMVVTSYPIAVRNTLTVYNKENRGIDR